MIGMMPCAICREKNNSSSLEQLKRIREFLERNVDKDIDSMEADEAGIARVFMHSTHNHCRYGLTCQSLSNMTIEANNIAIMIENKIAAFVQNADKAKLHELLSLVQGYFPQAYVMIEHYWFECQKERGNG